MLKDLKLSSVSIPRIINTIFFKNSEEDQMVCEAVPRFKNKIAVTAHKFFFQIFQARLEYKKNVQTIN